MLFPGPIEQREMDLPGVVACVFLESGLASSSEGTLPTHGKQAPVAGLSYLGKSRPRQKEVVLTTRMPLELMTHTYIGGMGRIGGGHCCK